MLYPNRLNHICMIYVLEKPIVIHTATELCTEEFGGRVYDDGKTLQSAFTISCNSQDTNILKKTHFQPTLYYCKVKNMDILFTSID